MFLWLRMLFQRLKQRDKIQILMYVMTCRESDKCTELLEKMVQLG